jgi:hypothetical protein
MLTMQHMKAAAWKQTEGAIMKFICAFTILGMFLSLATGVVETDLDGNAGRYATAALANS